jgi:hypothetical protein
VHRSRDTAATAGGTARADDVSEAGLSPWPAWLTQDERSFGATYPVGSRPSAAVLNRILARALRSHLVTPPDPSALATRSLLLELELPLPPRLRFYVYRAGQHAAERQAGSFRIQMTTNAADYLEVRRGRKKRYKFPRRDNVRPVVVGYEPDLKLFILWDADVIDAGAGFPYSCGVQAPPELVFGALATGLRTGTRYKRTARATEQLIAARPERLADALELRVQLSNGTLLRGIDAG